MDRAIYFTYFSYRTLDCHGRGREFESRRPRHSITYVSGRS